MRILIAALAVALASGVLPSAVAETADDGRETLADAAPKTRAEQLDALFEALRAAGSADEAQAAERGIVELWLESGSETVDLLMTWTLKAIDEKNYALALDFLDRITTLEPDYVEGWNKRATVYYLTDDYGKSIADIERVLSIEPRHFGALAGLGTILRELGEETRALAAYRQALTLDPHMENVQEAIDELEKENDGKDI